MRPIDCPSEKDLRAYLERERGSGQPAGIDTHLVGCRACRLELLNWQAESADAFEIVPVPPKLKERVGKVATPRSSFFQYLTGSARAPAFALAAFVLIAITAAGLWRFASPVVPIKQAPEHLRSDGPRVVSLQTIFPAENSVVSGPAIEFKWNSVADVTGYAVEVLDDDGDIVYQAVTSTDHLTVDTLQAQLHPESKYYWHVTAKRADGTVIETNPTPFSIR